MGHLICQIPNLRHLYLDQNQLHSIQPNTLQRFENLEIVDLSYNNIAEIPAGAFRGLEHLMQLNLEGNRIIDVAPGAFANTPLLLLMLGHNCLSSVSQQMFQGVPFLRQLSLANNQIRLIQPLAFFHLANLHLLDLTNNKLQALDTSSVVASGHVTVLLQGENNWCYLFVFSYWLSVSRMEYFKKPTIVQLDISS